MRQGQRQGRGQGEAWGQEAVEGSQARDNWVWDQGWQEGQRGDRFRSAVEMEAEKRGKGKGGDNDNDKSVISPLSSEAMGRRQQLEMKASPSVSDS